MTRSCKSDTQIYRGYLRLKKEFLLLLCMHRLTSFSSLSVSLVSLFTHRSPFFSPALTDEV